MHNNLLNNPNICSTMCTLCMEITTITTTVSIIIMITTIASSSIIRLFHFFFWFPMIILHTQQYLRSTHHHYLAHIVEIARKRKCIINSREFHTRGYTNQRNTISKEVNSKHIQQINIDEIRNRFILTSILVLLLYICCCEQIQTQT